MVHPLIRDVDQADTVRLVQNAFQQPLRSMARDPVTANVPASLQQAINSVRGWCLRIPSWGRNSRQGLGTSISQDGTMRWGSPCAPGSTVRNRTTVAALKVNSGRQDTVRTFSGWRPGLGSAFAAIDRHFG
jgi:hypothetical protein